MLRMIEQPTPWFLRKRWLIPLILLMCGLTVVGTPLAVHWQQWRSYDRTRERWKAEGVIVDSELWLASLPKVDAAAHTAWFALLDQVQKLPIEDHVPERDESWGLPKPSATEAARARALASAAAASAAAERRAVALLPSASRPKAVAKPPFVKWGDRPIGEPPLAVKLYLERTRSIAASAAAILTSATIVGHSGGRGAWIRQTGQAVDPFKLPGSLLANRALVNILTYHALADETEDLWWQSIDALANSFRGAPALIDMMIGSFLYQNRDYTYMLRAIYRQPSGSRHALWLAEPPLPLMETYANAYALEMLWWIESARVARIVPWNRLPDSTKESMCSDSLWDWSMRAGAFHADMLNAYAQRRKGMLSRQELVASANFSRNPFELDEGDVRRHVCSLDSAMCSFAEGLARHTLNRAAAATVMARSATGAMPYAAADGSLPWLSVLAPGQPSISYERLDDRACRVWLTRPFPPTSDISAAQYVFWYRMGETATQAASVTPPPPMGKTELQRFIIELHLP